jgi:DNA-directed RNA polymerase specialized sigma24 family protein
VLTTDARSDIGVVWGDLSPRLRRYLTRLGCSGDLAEDLVQEVAVRALRAGVRFVDTEDLLRWCNVVGRNLYVDHVRATCRQPLEALAPDFDRASAHDVEAIVEHRMSWTDVMRGVGLLSRDDRVALFEPLLDEAVSPATRTEATRLAVRRHRARGRLRAVLQTAVVLLGGCWAQLRSWLRPGPAAAVALTGVSFFALSALPSTAPPSGGAVPDTVARVAAHAVENPVTRTTLSRATTTVTRGVGSSRVPTAGSRPDVSVEVARTGFGARTGTTGRSGGEIACAGLVAGREDVCVAEPDSVVARLAQATRPLLPKKSAIQP